MLDKIKEEITKRLESLPFSVISAVIYGSCAKEEQREHSDIDILLISDGLNPKRHRRGKDIASEGIVLKDTNDFIKDLNR